MTDGKRVLEVPNVDNLVGGTKRVYTVNSIDNTRGGTKRVIVVGGGGGNIDELNVTPSTSAQTITASGGTDGYSPVNVAAVTSSIDANIVAGNIKKDVSILGVTGTYEGATPTGTMYIISNGTYNVVDKAIANVNVPTAVPASYIEYTVDGSGNAVPVSHLDLTGVSKIYDYRFYYAFSTTNVDGFSWGSPNITSVGKYGLAFMFSNAIFTNTVVRVNGLVNAGGNNALSNMFSYSTITELYFPDLESLGSSSATSLCSNTSVTKVYFNKLSTVNANSFGTGSSSYAFKSTNSLLEIHFPTASQATIEAMTGYADKWGATNATIYFDL